MEYIIKFRNLNIYINLMIDNVVKNYTKKKRYNFC